MPEPYDRFIALYPYPHERIQRGEPHEELNRRYLNRCEKGREEGFTPVVVALDQTLLGTMLNNISVRTGVPSESVTAEQVRQHAHTIIEEYHSALAGASVESLAHSAFERLSPDTFKGSYHELIEGEALIIPGEYGTEATAAQPKPLTLMSAYINEEADTQNSDAAGELILLDMPVTEPAEALAYLPFGGWVGCPDAADFMAIAHYWQERDEAVPAVVAAQYTEFYTPEPVNTTLDAAILAAEQCMLSPAMLTDVYRGFSKLSESLYGSHNWYIWWR